METPERRESCGCGCETPPPHVSFAKRRLPGIVFHPLDHQLIGFLRRRLSGEPLQEPHPFMELNVYKHTPQQLSELNGCGDRERVWYFFTTRDRKYKNGARPNREAGGGFWKATASAVEIVHDGQVIGWKRSLVYYNGKPPHAVKTDWIMHEFTAKDADYNNDKEKTRGENGMQLDGYAICKIRFKKSKSKLEDHKAEGGKTDERKRKIVTLTKDQCKAPHEDPGDHDFHGESSSPVPRSNCSTPPDPYGQAAMAELLKMLDDVSFPDQTHQQLQAAQKGAIRIEHAGIPNELIADDWPLDIFDWWDTQEQQQQMANHGAINYSHSNGHIDPVAGPPPTPFICSAHGQPQTGNDRAAVFNFNPAYNASDDSVSNVASAVEGLPSADEDSSRLTADFGDDELLDRNQNSLWRYYNYNERKIEVDINPFEDCAVDESCNV